MRFSLSFRIIDCEDSVSTCRGDIANDIIETVIDIVLLSDKAIVGTVFNAHHDAAQTSRSLGYSYPRPRPTSPSNPPSPNFDCNNWKGPVPTQLATPHSPSLSLLHPNHGRQWHYRVIHHFGCHNKGSSSTITRHDPLLDPLPWYLIHSTHFASFWRRGTGLG